MPEEDKYHVLEKIGHGSFGIIRKVKRKSDGYILCRKEISYSKMSQKEREQLQAELSILKELRHPNIVAYFERDHIKISQDLHLYMEYCGNGDLGKIISDLKRNNKLCEEEFVWSTFSQIVSALYRCHYGEDAPPAGRNVMGLTANAKPKRNPSRPMILHRDLKPENIFLGQDNSVKLGDFGLSKILQSHDFASTYVGTPFYMSPEICKAEQYGPHSDIWALGCIIYEMCAKAPPFNAKTHFELIQKIKAGKYEEIPAIYSPDLRKVIASCLQTTPHHRPDTAALLNLPIVKLMRKEQEVVRLGQELKRQKDITALREKEANQRVASMRQELEDQLRREWEVKARLEIDRQVKIRVEQELQKLRNQFEEEVQKRVNKAVAENKHTVRLSTSPKLAPRSSTPTMPAERGDIFPAEGDTAIARGSQSTLDSNSDFPSSTDISSLSLDDSTEDTVTVKPAPPKRSARQGLSRAKTYAVGAVSQPPPSPMDIQMAEASPAPNSVAHLSLSPRRNQPRQNIFAAAKDGAKKWELELPPTPTEEEWNRDFDDDDIPTLPSPTRNRSASGSRPNSRNEDPFKVLAGAAQRQPLKPFQRLGSAPSLPPNQTKTRPASVVPVVTGSPTRQKSKSADVISPRKAHITNLPTASKENALGPLKSKKGNDAFRREAMRNNVQGRTLVELNQARGIPVQAVSEDEGKRGFGLKAGLRSPIKAKLNPDIPLWDPETEPDMPSPFIKKTRPMIK